MIPKIIHYCWFGRGPKPALAKKCIKSWKKYCKDYKIVEWNEDNFDINCNQYVKEAYEAKKFAFVTDYVRLYALYHHGGIYMDTDVELLKPIDRFLVHKAFSGFEDNIHIPTAIMGSEIKGAWIKYLLSYYDNRHFIKEDGSFDLTTNVITITDMTHDKYHIDLNNSYQETDDFVLYTKDYFCPKTYSGIITLTNNTTAIHHFNGSWVPKEEIKKRTQVQRKVRRELFIDKAIHLPNRIMKKLLGDERYEKFKKIFKR